MPGLETIILAIVFGVGIYSLSHRLRMPAILFYLAGGLLLGPMGLALFRPAALGDGLLTLVELAVAVILFEGGLSLSAQSFGRAPGAIVRILAITMPATAIAGALLSHWLLGFSPHISLVFGSIIVVTGPTVIGPMLRHLSLTPRLESMLRWESIWGDTTGVLLSALAIKLLTITEATPILTSALLLLRSVAAGGVVGLAAGLLLARYLLPWSHSLGDPALPGIMAFAVALLAFLLANRLEESSGPLAAAVAGYALSRHGSVGLHSVRHFKDQLSIIFISTLFILLMSGTRLSSQPLDWVGIVAVAVLLGGVVRPVAVFAALAGTAVPVTERTYVGFIGPRGIVALATSYYAILTVPSRAGELELMHYTILVVIVLSGAVATLMGRPLARLLKITVPPSRGGILLVGPNDLAYQLAHRLKQYVPVAFLNTEDELCEAASWRGHQSICPDALDEDVYRDASEEGFTRLLAISRDDGVNQLVSLRAANHLAAGNIFCGRGRRRRLMEMAVQPGVMPAFGEGVVIADLLDAIAAGRAKLITVDSLPEGYADLLPLCTITPEGGVQLLSGGEPPTGKLICLQFRNE